jgi:hypothetical protein
MGVYATLIDAKLKYPDCSHEIKTDWQFNYGSVSKLPSYRVGDDILWGPLSYGEPTSYIVYAVAYPSSEDLCPNCNRKDILALVAILGNRIKGLEYYKYATWVKETVLIGLDKKAKSYKETKYKNND